MTDKRRLDTLLAERGLFPSRSRAAASVMAGEVFLEAARAGDRGDQEDHQAGGGARERRAEKPGELVDVATRIRLAERPVFVSRGGVKLANALDASGLQVRGRTALDVGASTGGFTDCLLQRGAAAVIAVDVGYGTLDYRLRGDPRVVVMERTNARVLAPEMLATARSQNMPGTSAAAQSRDTPSTGAAPDLATIDVSFISINKILTAVLACLARPYDVLALVKPQFELGRGRVGKGGVVRASDDRREALVAVAAAALELGAAVVGFYSSGLPGPKGNRETFVWLTAPCSHENAGRGEGAGAGPDGLGPRGTRDVDALEGLAREVEP